MSHSSVIVIIVMVMVCLCLVGGVRCQAVSRLTSATLLSCVACSGLNGSLCGGHCQLSKSL